MSCCTGAKIGKFSCCNGSNNNFDNGTSEASLTTILTNVCQKKLRRNFMQDVYGKRGGRAASGCCPLEPCCPEKGRLRQKCRDPCRPLRLPTEICPKLRCPCPGTCYITPCGNPNRPMKEPCYGPCTSVMVVRPLRNPCCPLPRKCCPPPPPPCPTKPACPCPAPRPKPKPVECLPCEVCPCCAPKPTKKPIQIVGSCGNCCTECECNTGCGRKFA